MILIGILCITEFIVRLDGKKERKVVPQGRNNSIPRAQNDFKIHMENSQLANVAYMREVRRSIT